MAKHPHIRKVPLPPIFTEWVRGRWPEIPDLPARVARRYEVTLLSSKKSWRETEEVYLVEGRGGRRAPYVEWYDIDSRDDAWATRARAETIKVYDDAPGGAHHFQIPPSRLLAYRGMSWEEWQATKHRGFVKSAGHYNFTSQEGHTCFSSDPGQAEHYAGGFAPWPFQPGPGAPGIVIAVPRPHAQWANNQPVRREKGPAHFRREEMFCTHRIPLTDVKGVWALVCTKVKPGTVEFGIDPNRALYKSPAQRRLQDPRGQFPDMDYTVVQIA